MLGAKSIKNWLMAVVLAVSFGGFALTIIEPSTVAAASGNCTESFVGLPAWYRGLLNDQCDVKSPANSDELNNYIWHIVLNVLEGALIIGGYLTGFYFLYGGFLFISSQGKPEGAAKARLTMMYAAMGLGIIITSVAIVNFIVEQVLQ
jgi:hypothetical protein